MHFDNTQKTARKRHLSKVITSWVSNNEILIEYLVNSWQFDYFLCYKGARMTPKLIQGVELE